MTRGKRVAVIVLWMVCGGALLCVAMARLDLQRLWTSIASAHIGLLAVAFALSNLAIYCKAIKWHVVLRPVSTTSTLALAAALYAGAAASAALPARLDEFVRAFVAVRFTRVPAMPLFGSIAVERLIDFVVLLLMLLLAGALLPLPPWLSSAVRVVGLISLGLGGTLFVLRFLSTRLRRPGGLSGVVKGLAYGTDAVLKPNLLLLALLATIVQWAFIASMVALVAVAQGIDLPLGGVLLLTILCVGSFAVPITPAGIGVFEVASRLALPALFDVDEEQAVAVALGVHVLLLLPALIGGTAVLAFGGISMDEVRTWRDRVREPECGIDNDGQ